MKIYRNGVEIELTRRELMEAGHEYQHLCDIEDVLSMRDYYQSEKEFRQDYGIGFDVLENIAESVAYLFRKYRDNDETWWDDVQYAINEKVSERGLAE